MDSTAGRNDPCPCGSGKKYKKCCYEKDMRKARPPAFRFSQPSNLTKKTIKATKMAAETSASTTDAFKQRFKVVQNQPIKKPAEDNLLVTFDEVDYRQDVETTQDSPETKM